jgi:phosphoribosyl-ATP pyrophosphohydrolase/phosphoribosyl-AMP cyclohydrolase
MSIDFSKFNNLVPCIVQDAKTLRVLMLGFMNEEAYKKTVDEKRVVFFSRTKNRLWMKGETSGNFLDVAEIIIDCDNDTLLIKATPRGPVCHTGADTCFNEKNEEIWNLESLENTIQDRKKNQA